MDRKKLLKFLSLCLGAAGFGVLGYVFFPIFIYEILSTSRFSTYLSPVPDSQEFIYANEVKPIDFTKPDNWFEGDPELLAEEISQVKFYTLSIPKLNIKSAAVAIGGEDLAESLIQYPGTALPGQRGNAVIFGHSILPQFYDPTDYLTIFSTLPTLKKGDQIYIDYDGISYIYRIEDMFEVKPSDIQVLEQNPSDSFITLVTCVPPGHPLRPKRLIVRARLVPITERSVNDNTRT